jgi:hypothetical protein
MTTQRVGLVSCGRQKRAEPSRARDLYTSTLFKLAREYCERTCVRWYILSAEHGLLPPEVLVDPYNRTLLTMSKQQRHDWGRKVVEQYWIQRLAYRLRDCVVEVHAGFYYVQALRWSGLEFVEPLKGLQIGERLAWYAGRLRPAGGG